MKKQIAVLMAAATAVTTVAPVLANAEVNKKDVSLEEISKAMKDALNERYADKKHDGVNNNAVDAVDDYLNSRYAVLISINGGVVPVEDGLSKVADTVYDAANANSLFDDVSVGKANVTVVKDASKAAKIIEKYIGQNSANVVKVYIVDKGIKDKSATYMSDKKVYKVGANVAPTNEEVTLGKLAADIQTKPFFEAGSIKYDSTNNPDTTSKVEFKLKSGEEITVNIGDEALDLTKGYDKNNVEYDLSSPESLGESVLKAIVKFAVIKRDDGKSVTRDVKTGDATEYTVKDVEKTSVIEIPTVYSSETGYTQNGADFVNKLTDAKANKLGNKFTFNHNGVSYTLAKNKAPVNNHVDAAAAIHTNTAKIEKDGDKYVLKLNVDVIDANDNGIAKTLQFVIEGKNQKDLARVLKDIKDGNKVVAGQFTKLAGSNRYATAIEISREAFEKNDSADTVVIVGGNALMDGLSAGPLASAKNAPILLADAKSGLNNDTLNEIDRVCDNLKNKTVYIVGGDSSVPKSVEKQLKDKFGAVVVRISGKDRYETSLDVTRRLGYEKVLETGVQGAEKGNVYFVGGEGAADAMSIAGVASKFVGGKVDGPIVVVPKNEISRKTRDFISSKYFKKAYFIGGDGNLSTNVYKTPGLAKEKERVSGKDRFETNVEILNKKEFYTKPQVDGAIFASGDNKYLVDAQTSAVLSVDKKAPIVLTGKKLTDSQVDLLKKDGLLSGVKSNVYQVGGVVSADVMKVVVDKLGL